MVKCSIAYLEPKKLIQYECEETVDEFIEKYLKTHKRKKSIVLCAESIQNLKSPKFDVIGLKYQFCR